MRIFRFIGMALVAMLMCVNFVSCNSSKNYKVSFGEGVVYITMRCPSRGISSWRNEVSFDGFTPDDIEKEVFKGIRNRGYSGNYDIYVTLQFLDNYGNYNDSKEKVKVSTLNGDDVKKYTDFGYFKGKVSIDKSYPWNHNYHNK